MVKSKNKIDVNNELPIPRGRPKSGRVWKTVKQRYSSLLLGKSLRTTWAEKMKLKMERKVNQDYDKAMRDAKAKFREEKRRRTELNKKRKLENERKSQVVQKITNMAKLKRMTKKQLRSIEKR